MTEAAARTSLPGKRLRAAREEMGLSEAEVARKLHMSVTFVRAIEADDYDRLPEATFIKGYLRNYARLLNVPADEVANLFSQLVEDEPPRVGVEPSTEPAAKKSWVLPAIVVLLVVAVSVWWSWQSEGQRSQDESAGEDAIVAEADVASAEVPEMLEPSEANNTATAEAGDASAEASAEVDPVVAPSPQPEPAIVEDQVRISFNGPCWVQVKDSAGAVLFSGNKDAGNDLVLSATGPFRFTFGNGAAVAAMTINGQSFTVPASVPGKVVRFRAP